MAWVGRSPRRTCARPAAGVLAPRLTAGLHASGAADACRGARAGDVCGLGERKPTSSLLESLVGQGPCAPQFRSTLGASHALELAALSCQGHTLVRSRQTQPRSEKLVVTYSNDQALLNLTTGHLDSAQTPSF